MGVTSGAADKKGKIVNSGILHLNAADLASLRPSAAESADAIDRFYKIHAEGRVHLQPKLTLDIGPESFFQSLCCAVAEPAYAICKWIGVFYGNQRIGLPNINGSAILSDASTGAPLAMLDGAALTAFRTAATSLSAARLLARRDAQTIGFVGTGIQAHSHLELFSQAFDRLGEVRILSSHPGFERLERRASELGLRCVLSEDPRIVVEGSDILVTSVPGTISGPFLDAGWLPPGAFVSAVDLGRSWKLEAISSFDFLATDDRDNSVDQQAQGIMPAVGDFRADLAELVSGAHPGRVNATQRTAFIFPGFALSDLAIAALFYEAARDRNVGTEMDV